MGMLGEKREQTLQAEARLLPRAAGAEERLSSQVKHLLTAEGDGCPS